MTKNKFDLSNKSALITGAGGLLGGKHAEALLENNANVIDFEHVDVQPDGADIYGNQVVSQSEPPKVSNTLGFIDDLTFDQSQSPAPSPSTDLSDL